MLLAGSEVVANRISLPEQLIWFSRFRSPPKNKILALRRNHRYRNTLYSLRLVR